MSRDIHVKGVQVPEPPALREMIQEFFRGVADSDDMLNLQRGYVLSVGFSESIYDIRGTDKNAPRGFDVYAYVEGDQIDILLRAQDAFVWGCARELARQLAMKYGLDREAPWPATPEVKLYGATISEDQ